VAAEAAARAAAIRLAETSRLQSTPPPAFSGEVHLFSERDYAGFGFMLKCCGNNVIDGGLRFGDPALSLKSVRIGG
jgi:hypothetical protein